MHSPLLPHGADSPPLSESPSHSNRTRPSYRVFPIFGRAGSAGLFIGGVASRASDWRLRSPYGPKPPPHAFPDTLVLEGPSLSTSSPVPLASEIAIPLVPPQPQSDELDLEELRDMVSGTKGFFARDYSLGLGWNNMRYIIEAALIQSRLLNRTLVLPSFVYARACEYNITVCAEYATMVNKGDAVGWEEWRELPIEQQMGWEIPMSLMFNLTHLRQTQPVILVSDYLRLHGQGPEVEFSNGAWQRELYHQRANVFEKDKTKLPSLYVIENHWYDPSRSNRVDLLPDAVKQRGNWSPEGWDKKSGRKGHWPYFPQTEASERLQAALESEKSVLDWDEAREALQAKDGIQLWDVSSDEKLEQVLRANGWEVLHTFRGALGMDYTKTVSEPIRQVVPRSSLRGFVEEYADRDEDVVILAGETHLGRKPGALRFTTVPARDDFARLVLFNIQPVDKVLDLADTLNNRMKELTEGRLWMGAHMRRGDFVRLGWAMESTPEAHIRRVKEHLDSGRQTILSLTELDTYDVPDVHPDMDQLDLAPPLPDDPFYIATDERDPEALDIISKGGAVFMSDLLTIEDRRAFGWPLMITDVRALVEQATLAHSAYFYAHAMSSVAGGIVNMRAARGVDPRTILLD
ncbi:hypothetical protein EW146_g25 [Bondarzewia mesenterica]|uniref:O-fucosyltransferase family protein n=1 Tax=Bondarzewia mesenterica TaxID=1095465 RepID=A0A4S4MAF9_9AGAM|nr:hypothetical protein EW146_g25 [Bondarzewia mesenterica]